jgi:predicted esterase
MRHLPLIFAVSALPAHAAQNVALPAWECTHPDAIFVSALDSPETRVPHDPSFGSGGSTGSSVARTVHVAGLGSGSQTYYVYAPKNLPASQPLPVLLALHGYVPYGTQTTYAQGARTSWGSVAAGADFIVVAPVGNDIVYQDGQPYGVSWLVPPTSGPNDYDLFAAVLADVESAYNIDRTRIYAWGFSAGGSVVYDLGLSNEAPAFSNGTLAAISVSSGVLGNLACSYNVPNSCDRLLASVPRKLPIDIHVGTGDGATYTAAQSDDAELAANGWTDGQTLFFSTFNGGHTYSSTDLFIAWSHICPTAVTP